MTLKKPFQLMCHPELAEGSLLTSETKFSVANDTHIVSVLAIFFTSSKVKLSAIDSTDNQTENLNTQKPNC